MHVDHFNPTIKGKKRNHFTNLMLASAHCNLRKSNRWPSASDELDGLRFLNCTEEQDYGQHIFEDLNTGKLYWIRRQVVSTLKDSISTNRIYAAREDRELIFGRLRMVVLLTCQSSESCPRFKCSDS
jgi:hypothetical protein